MACASMSIASSSVVCTESSPVITLVLRPKERNPVLIIKKLEDILLRHITEKDPLSRKLFQWGKKLLQTTPDELADVAAVVKRVDALFDLLRNPLDKSPLCSPVLLGSVPLERWMAEDFLDACKACSEPVASPFEKTPITSVPPRHSFAEEMRMWVYEECGLELPSGESPAFLTREVMKVLDPASKLNLYRFLAENAVVSARAQKQTQIVRSTIDHAGFSPEREAERELLSRIDSLENFISALLKECNEEEPSRTAEQMALCSDSENEILLARTEALEKILSETCEELYSTKERAAAASSELSASQVAYVHLRSSSTRKIGKLSAKVISLENQLRTISAEFDMAKKTIQTIESSASSSAELLKQEALLQAEKFTEALEEMKVTHSRDISGLRKKIEETAVSLESMKGLYLEAISDQYRLEKKITELEEARKSSNALLKSLNDRLYDLEHSSSCCVC